jgi:hypothetical protein
MIVNDKVWMESLEVTGLAGLLLPRVAPSSFQVAPDPLWDIPKLQPGNLLTFTSESTPDLLDNICPTYRWNRPSIYQFPRAWITSAPCRNYQLNHPSHGPGIATNSHCPKGKDRILSLTSHISPSTPSLSGVFRSHCLIDPL